MDVRCGLEAALPYDQASSSLQAVASLAVTKREYGQSRLMFSYDHTLTFIHDVSESY